MHSIRNLEDDISTYFCLPREIIYDRMRYVILECVIGMMDLISKFATIDEKQALDIIAIGPQNDKNLVLFMNASTDDITLLVVNSSDNVLRTTLRNK